MLPLIKYIMYKFEPKTNIINDLHVKITELLNEYDEKDNRFLFKHQYILAQYLTGRIIKNIPRGLLIYHQLGTGKTITIITISLALKRHTIVIMPNALFENFDANLQKVSKATNKKYEEVKKYFTYLSLDAYNLYDKLSKMNDGNLNGYTLIVDEAHELFSQMTNAGNVNGPNIYNLIMQTVDIYLIFATGTPIIKDPYELVPCVNMLTGKILLPHDYETFNNLYIGNIWKEIEDAYEKDEFTEMQDKEGDRRYIFPNADFLKNRLLGLVSYARADPSLFPSKMPVIVKYVPMDMNQWVAYTIEREVEVREIAERNKFASKGKIKVPNNGIGKPKSKVTSTFRQKSRALCNLFVDSNGIKHMTKIEKVVRDINRHRKKGIVYSQFKKYGIYCVADLLVESGWEEIIPFERTDVEEVPVEIADADVKVKGGNDVYNSIIEEHINKRINSLKPKETFTLVGGNEDRKHNKFKLASYEEKTSDNDDDNNDEIEIINNLDIENRNRLYPPASKKFAILCGDRPKDIRNQIIAIYNNTETNNYGEQLALLLVTEVGTRGLSLKTGIYTYAVESYWTWHLFDQLEGRIVRNGSHDTLPPELRQTRMFIYLSDKPNEVDCDDEELVKLDNPKEGYTTDTVLYSRAIKRQLVLDICMQTLKEVAIECTNLKKITNVDEQINCYRCQANNEVLYSNDVNKDIKYGNPCQKLQEKKITVNTIKVDDVEYKYSKVDHSDKSTFYLYDYNVYTYNADLESWVKLSDKSDLFKKILNQIMAENA